MLGLQAIGDNLVDSVVSDNIPIFTEEEKFNEAVSSIVKRVEAKLTGAAPSHNLTFTACFEGWQDMPCTGAGGVCGGCASLIGLACSVCRGSAVYVWSFRCMHGEQSVLAAAQGNSSVSRGL